MNAPCACTTVRKANRALFRFYEAAMEGTGVTITQFSILRALARKGPTPLSDLADDLVMERTSLYRTLRPLEQGACVRVAASDRGRAKIASLTPKGRRTMAAAAGAWVRAHSAVIAAIGAQNWRVLSAALLKIPPMLETKP